MKKTENILNNYQTNCKSNEYNPSVIDKLVSKIKQKLNKKEQLRAITKLF